MINLGYDLVGVRAEQYGTVRYTDWPGSLEMLILQAGIPEGKKRGDRIYLCDIPVIPSISQQLIKHIGQDLRIAKSFDSYLKQYADNHWIMQEGGLYEPERQKWMVW